MIRWYTLTAEINYSINFTENTKKFCRNSALWWSKQLFNGTEIINFKAKDSEIAATLLCPGNISKDSLVDDMKKTELNGYVYDFSVNYDAVAVDDILDIHRYLMK